MSLLIGLVIAGGVGFWVRSDAQTLASQGVKVGSFGPDGWFWGVFLLLIIFLPMYLIQRSGALRTGTAVGAMPPGWFPDPTVPGQYRWWDGMRWTDQTSPMG